MYYVSLNPIAKDKEGSAVVDVIIKVAVPASTIEDGRGLEMARAIAGKVGNVKTSVIHEARTFHPDAPQVFTAGDISVSIRARELKY
jgi:hypothetical protein